MTSSRWHRPLRRIGFIIMLALLVAVARMPTVTARQAGCSDTFRAALNSALQYCANIGLNMMCLGGLPASITAKAGAAVPAAALGSTANVDDVASLSLGGYNPADASWGIARLLLQANLPGNNPGAGVTMIVFGDTTVAAAPGSGGMQAFYLQTAGASSCAGIPTDGVMIQSPRGQQKVQLVANGVQLSIGSTVFLNIQTDDDGISHMKVRTLQGEVNALLGDQEVLIEAGEESGVEIVEGDEEFEYEPVGELEEDHPFDDEYFIDFPIDELPEELSWDEIYEEWDQADDQEDSEFTEEEQPDEGESTEEDTEGEEAPPDDQEESADSEGGDAGVETEGE